MRLGNLGPGQAQARGVQKTVRRRDSSEATTQDSAVGRDGQTNGVGGNGLAARDLDRIPAHVEQDQGVIVSVDHQQVPRRARSPHRPGLGRGLPQPRRDSIAGQ